MAASHPGPPAHIFGKSMFGVITILVLGFSILIRGQKQKQEFYQVTGPIVTIGQQFANVSNRHEGKMRYLQVSNYSKVFEVFIGKDPSDFSPAFENIDALKAGDIVTVHYDEDQSNAADIDVVNRLAQFIDKRNKPYYIRGSKDMYGGYGAIGTGLFIGIFLLALKKKGTIV